MADVEEKREKRLWDKEVLSMSFANMDLGKQIEAVELLAGEFYGGSDEGLNKFSESLFSGREEAFCLVDSKTQEIAAVNTIKRYEFGAIAPQLFLEPRFEDGRVDALRLRSFGDLLEDKGFVVPYDSAIEAAYALVVPKHRGKGYMTKLLDVGLSSKVASGKEIVFTLAMSPHAGTGLFSKLTESLLSFEEAVNGMRADGLVNVSGEWVDAEVVSPMVGIDLSSVNQYGGIGHTIHLFEKDGGRFIGFSRNLSPVWVIELGRE